MNMPKDITNQSQIFLPAIIISLFCAFSATSAEPIFKGNSEYIKSVDVKMSPELERSANIGSTQAQVGVMEFFDFGCAHCGEFQKTTFPELKRKYVDTGKVRYYFRDFVLRSNRNTAKAASIANCANEQGKYTEAMDVLFSNPDFIAREQFDALIEALPGINTPKLRTCLNSPQHKNELRGEELFPSKKSFDDIHEGSDLGVRGTPAFVVFKMRPTGEITQGTFLRGAHNLQTFTQVIDLYLGQ